MTDNKRKVLIIEDELALANALKLKFESGGYNTVLYSDGESALKFLSSEKVDVIIMDLMLPGIDGFSILKKMPELNVNNPVFVATNLGHNDDEKKIISYPQVKAYFVKSSTALNDIIESVNSYFKDK